MQVFEDRLCSTWEEQDTLAVLTAVLTFDGARQWVFYTDDIDECSYQLHYMPQEKDPYPLELSCRPDPEWSFLRTEVLKTVT